MSAYKMFRAATGVNIYQLAAHEKEVELRLNRTSSTQKSRWCKIGKVEKRMFNLDATNLSEN